MKIHEAGHRHQHNPGEPTRKGDRFVIRSGPKIAVTAAKVQSILITTAVYFSSDVIALSIVHNFRN